MKIILINSLAAGGAEKVVTILAKELHKRKHKIELVCLEKKIDYKLPENIKISFLSNDKGTGSGFIKFLKLILLAWKLKQKIIKQKVTIVQSHLYRANYVNIIAKILGSSHIAQIVNGGTISWYKTKGILGRINLLLIKYLYDKADLIVLKNYLMLKDMQDLFSFKTKKQIIHNPYDFELIENKKNEALDNSFFNSKNFYIISAGRLIPLKNYDILIKAFKIAKEKLNNIKLVFLGNGDEKDNLLRLCYDLCIDKDVYFTDYVDNPFKYISKSQLFVLPSSTEGFPNVLVEAMICKTPVIATDCLGGSREILDPLSDLNFRELNDIDYAEYGVLVPVKNINMLSKAIISIFENSSLHNKYKSKAYKRAKDFSLDKIIPEYEKILNLNT